MNGIGNGPQPGFYQTRLTKGGPFVPARVWFNIADRDEAGDLMDDECMMMEIDGKRIQTELAMNEKWLWMYGWPITKADYDFMMADSKHAKEHRPDDPKATPTKTIDLSTQRPIF